jgi:hypothetical protein
MQYRGRGKCSVSHERRKTRPASGAAHLHHQGRINFGAAATLAPRRRSRAAFKAARKLARMRVAPFRPITSRRLLRRSGASERAVVRLAAA